ncbi:PAS domain S-box protein [Methylomicrobium lacus]|uniref:PAS domain S-box protein n=1 Tax=Methylomicrobium lacus TaxID=136992 RepID=UPI00045E8913|nr:PAS domain S-box protein [Methylomicrobium lacus]
MNFKRFKTQSIILYFDAQPYGLRYGWAMLTVAIAAIATLYVPVIGERAAFLLFFFAIIQTSFWLGRNPGIFAMFLSLIAVNALILFPASILKSYDVLILNAGFCVLSAVIVATTSLHRRLTGALWESRQRYAGIVESALDALITIDADQHILLFNAAAEKMFGCTADEAVGGSLERFIPKRFRPAHAAHIRAFGSTGASNRKMGELAAVKGLRADGEEFPIEAAISLCEINGEKSFTAILRDVTERVRADSALKEQLKLQDQLTKVAATVPGVICSFRLRPDGSACMPYASPVFESVYGLKPDAVAKDFSPIFARVHPRDIGHIHETIAESARTMQPWQDCFRYDHPTKGEIWIEGHSIPLREADGSTLWHGYIQDMTWEKKTELERQKFISLADNSQEFIGMCDMNLLPIDIEERKQAEQQITFLNRHLQRRIEEMQAIFDTAPIGLSIADDTTGCRIRGNPAIERMLGLAPGSELSLEGDTPAPICAMLNGRELAVEELPIQRANRGEVVTNQIIDISRPDGLVITVLSNASPLFNEEGFPRGAVGAFLDITELKRVEDSLTKSQTQLRTFIEQAPLSIAMFDREMNYLVTSRRWIEEFGRGYDDLTGRNHYWVNPDISAEWREIHVKAQAGAFLKNDDDLWIQADGSRHWLRWAAYPWTNQEGKIGGIIISCEDITARRTAEEELRTVQTRLAIVVEAVKAGYWDWDLNTSSVYLSPEWKRQIGFDENELLNRWEEWECRLHPDDRASVLAAAENYISGLLPVFELEFRLRHKDGLYRWVHSRGGLLRDPNNRPYRMLGINLDITDYKKQKELSERRDKMEQSFRLYVVTQTAAAIAHELHQPLAAISSYAEVALHMLQAGNQNPEKLGSLMEICAQQAQRAGGVIRQLMTVLHKDEALSESIDINQLAREALELVKAAGHLGVFSIELNLAAALPPVWANSLQIEKVLINLLRNGLESMQESGLSAGTITLTTRSTDDTPAMAQVTVRDGGKSVTDIAILKNMFQPFYTTKPQGLGMGLAISRALIEAHGGRMWAEQNAGNGISVHFTLSFVT